MGMYDEIYVEHMWCPFCGTSIDNKRWQTKSGECLLTKYESLEDFEKQNYQLGSYEIHNPCTNCENFIELTIFNKSTNYLEWVSQRNKEMREFFDRTFHKDKK